MKAEVDILIPTQFLPTYLELSLVVAADMNFSPWGPSLPARTFHRQMPPGPLTALYGTWIMLRMAKPMLTRARAKAKKRSSRIVTWRPALSSFTRCGKTGKRRHSQYFSNRAGLKFIESRPAYPRGFNRAERARQQGLGFQKAGDFLR